MVIVIDNYDSFTYNLVQYLGELGADLTVFRNDEVTVDEVEALHPSHVVISPGPCTPAQAGISVDLVRRLGAKVPILGVCLGHQAIAEAYGGTIVRAPVPVHGKTALIHHDSKGLFRGIDGTFEATRYHSLVVEEESLPGELEVTARTRDGLIMGVRHRKHPVEGVQFHPESVLTQEGKRLLEAFLNSNTFHGGDSNDPGSHQEAIVES